MTNEDTDQYARLSFPTRPPRCGDRARDDDIRRQHGDHGTQSACTNAPCGNQSAGRRANAGHSLKTLLPLLSAGLAAATLNACAVAGTTAKVVGFTAVTTVKAGGAVIDGAVDIIDDDDDEEITDEDCGTKKRKR